MSIRKIENKILFLLGLFSSFQLAQIANTTIFAWLVLVMTLYFAVTRKKIKKFRGFLLGYIICAAISEGLLPFLNVNNKLNWQIESLKSWILLLTVLIFAGFLACSDKEQVQMFFKGLYYSCIVQVIWSFLQYLLYYYLKINLNEVVFKDILGSTGAVSQMEGNTLKLTGLTCNAGILYPIFIFGLLATKNIVFKVLIILICLLSGSSTAIIFALSYLLIHFVLHRYGSGIKLWKAIPKKRMILAVLFGLTCFLVLLFGGEYFAALTMKFNEFADRILTIGDKTQMSASTHVHLGYYTNIWYIFKNSSLIRILFGYGLKCSGIPFVVFFNQYVTSAGWVPETDFVTILFDTGIVGVVFLYGFLIKTAIKGFKIDYRYAVLILTIIISGFFYGVQMQWMILSEILILTAVERGDSLDQLIITESVRQRQAVKCTEGLF